MLSAMIVSDILKLSAKIFVAISESVVIIFVLVILSELTVSVFTVVEFTVTAFSIFTDKSSPVIDEPLRLPFIKLIFPFLTVKFPLKSIKFLK